MISYIFCLTAFSASACPIDAEPGAPPALQHAVVYRDRFYALVRECPIENRPYGIVARRLNNNSIRVVLDSLGYPRNDFESLFIRGRVLALGIDSYFPAPMTGSRSDDNVRYLSPERLCEASAVAVDRNGEPLKEYRGSLPSIWRRVTKLPIFEKFAPGETEILHTAVAPLGDRDLLIFDLVRTVPAEGKPAVQPRIELTRVVPEERVRIDEWSNDGKPESTPAGGMPAAFSEPFQAYVLGGDYYFATKSGAVYRSPPPARGRERTMAAVWAKPKPRVQFVISDGNRAGIHYLITPREPDGWDYSLLGPNPQPKKLPEGAVGDNDGPHVELAYNLAAALRNEKVIVTPPFFANAAEEAAVKAFSKPDWFHKKDDDGHVIMFDIAGSGVTDANLKSIAPLKNLKALYLSSNDVSDAGLKELVKFDKLTSLHLDTNQNVTDLGLKEIGLMVGLESLYLANIDVTNAGLKALAPLKELTALGLENTKVTDLGMKELVHLPKLSSLVLARTQVGDAGMKELAPLQNLTELDLSYSKVTDAGLKELKSHLKMDVLNLLETDVADSGMKELAALKGLTNLDVSETGVTDVGIEELAALTNLKEFKLRSTKATDASLRAIANLKKLTTLDISGTLVSDAGLAELAQLHGLTSLWMYKTKVTAAGIAKLQKALPKCTILHNIAK